MRDWLLQRYGLVAAGIGAVGVALILLSELAHTDWTRIFGAMFITIGGVGVGVWFGIASPRRWPLQSVLRRWRMWFGVAAAVLLSAPAMFALIASLVGILDGDGRSASDVTVAFGAVVAVVFTVAVGVALVLGIRAIGRAGRGVRAPTDGTDGPAA